MTERAKGHHSVPRDYLRQWSHDGLRVNSYRILVPDAGYPVWELRAIRSLSRYNELYTSVSSGDESDTFERWMNEEIETPAAEALDRATSDQSLSRGDCQALVRYLALLDLRTPAAYLEFVKRWNKQLPATMNEVMERVKREIHRAAKRSRGLPPVPSESSTPRFPMKVSIVERPAMDKIELHAQLTLGRELWLHSIKNAVLNTSEILQRQHWVIFQPHRGFEWFTSDHPVLRLNFTDEHNYDFGGGWGRKNGEIVLPLSPYHLLYTKIGDRTPRSGTLSSEHTALFQRLLAERAHRWIFSRGEPLRASWWRPRYVDRAAFHAEEAVWRTWHSEQTANEVSRPSADDSPPNPESGDSCAIMHRRGTRDDRAELETHFSQWAP